MNQVQGYIAIRPHLLRYVQWREHIQPGEPLIIPGISPVSQALDLCLTNKTTYLTAQLRREEHRAHEYSDRLPYLVRGARYNCNYLYVTAASAMAYNVYLHHLLHDDLRQRILSGQNAGHYEFNIILAFMAEVGIDDLVDFDAIKKAQYRLRKAAGYVMQRGRKARGMTHRQVQYAGAV